MNTPPILTTGDKLATGFNGNFKYTIDNPVIKKQISLVADVYSGVFFFMYHCRVFAVPEDYAWNGAQCVKCHMKSDFDVNSVACGTYDMIRFFDWKIELDMTKASLMNLRTFYGKMTIYQFNHPDYINMTPEFLISKFLPDLQVDG